MNKKKSKINQWIPAILLTAVSLLLLWIFPEAREPFGGTIASYTVEMISIFPAVLVLMGLMSVFISNQFIARHLGDTSGIRGMVLAFLLGTLPTGPLYMAFSLAATLKKKRARTANLVIFLSTWACIKLPQELVEMRFLGARFMMIRLLLTIGFVGLMALTIELLDIRAGAASRASGT
ncbi:MAG: hypothetical protein RQ801_07220 [Spirochaetaceae bacterium]|nr:hypothetical protein [Spirochaetaceae bacterium]MDT8298072.1 hypothetical protein [Spirochaetaceae bacterium]